MTSSFETDPYPGEPKILFIGYTESSHTHSWINLLEQAELNVRLFGLPSDAPPEGFKVKTYVTGITAANRDTEMRARFYSRTRVGQFYKKGLSRLITGSVRGFEERWLNKIIRSWQPDVIHTLGLVPASFFYFGVRRKYGLAGMGKWVLQLRGGSDLTLSRLDPELSPRIAETIRECDQLLSDNEENFKFAHLMGLKEEQITSLRTVPGTGGIDVDSLAGTRQERPSKRRMILWPKVADSPWAKPLPILEAIKLSWDRIQPCRINMLAVDSEVRSWLLTLPEQIQESCYLHERIPRDNVLKLMTEARVMLAPSLIDGTPNSMFEAMAAGALPIVSPLDTIRPVVRDEQNVLFARNLYPSEIAAALTRAMTDDVLVNRAAAANLTRVREIANRAVIRPRVIEFYKQLAKHERAKTATTS
jgi:glycosyltransferase involved in cell wall biosynthesis